MEDGERERTENYFSELVSNWLILRRKRVEISCFCALKTTAPLPVERSASGGNREGIRISHVRYAMPSVN